MASEKMSSVELLDLENYGTWSMRMKYLLVTKGLWGPVEAEEGVAVDRKEDLKALALIGLYVADHHLVMLRDCSTAKQAWTALESVYKTKSTARKLQLRKELAHLTKEPSEPMSKYVARARSLWNDLTAAGHSMAMTELTFSVLAGLPKEYETTVAILEASDGELDLDVVTAKLLHAEERLMRMDEDDSKDYTKVLYVKGDGGRGRRSGGVGGVGGRRGDNLQPTTKSTTPRHADKECYYCGRLGHIKAECRRRMVDDAAGWRESVALMAGVDVRADVATWVLDSGSTRHITPFKHLLEDERVLDKPFKVTFGNNTVALATSVGNVRVKTSVAHITLMDVLYVPGAVSNLFSVRQAAERGATTKFTSSGCIVEGPGGGCLAKMKAGPGELYCMDATYPDQDVKSYSAREWTSQRQEPVSKRGISVGGEPHIRAYCVLLEESSKEVVSADATIDEAVDGDQTGVCQHQAMGQDGEPIGVCQHQANGLLEEVIKDGEEVGGGPPAADEAEELETEGADTGEDRAADETMELDAEGVLPLPDVMDLMGLDMDVDVDTEIVMDAPWSGIPGFETEHYMTVGQQRLEWYLLETQPLELRPRRRLDILERQMITRVETFMLYAAMTGELERAGISMEQSYINAYVRIKDFMERELYQMPED